ncbi:hypothetical protein GSI_12177 [Ganoderma sinense ZZ0214-1]|uniref:Uncharacterized protein n=1 Tax=Ganoderma sinense ZZ0214-1 TaxID=1077348 RepID=A0A2G8RY28_9APHY|nr:hypothetical protein GSI_12177 [Ganoderma sinense ZZ0214-1]
MNGAASQGAASSRPADEAAALNGAMDLLLLTTMCTGILIPISIALFFTFSRIWRTPVFILNVLALALGFANGGLTINYVRTVFSGKIPESRLVLVFMSMSFLIPICVQCVLIIRVIAVYPPWRLKRMETLFIYGTFAVLFIARIVNMTLFLNKVAQDISSSGADTITISLYAVSLPNGKAEWTLQSINDLYASVLFLLRLNQAQVFRRNGGLASVLNTGNRSYTARLQALFWIAVFNFVFPVLLNVVIVVLSFRERNILRTTDVIMLNSFVEIICVLLATVCCTETYWDYVLPPTPGIMASRRPLGMRGGETTESLASVKFATPSLSEPHFAPSDLEMAQVRK